MPKRLRFGGAELGINMLCMCCDANDVCLPWLPVDSMGGRGVGGLNRVCLEAESCVLVWSLVQTISPSLYKCKNMELKGVRS